MRIFYKIDWLLFLAIILIFISGLFSIYSASQSKPLLKFQFQKQLLFGLVGFFLMFLVSFFDYRFLKNFFQPVTILYLFSIVLLIAVLFFGSPIRGSRSWFAFGNFSFSPSELTKLILIIVFAKYFSQRHVEIYHFQHIIISGFYVLLPAFLVLAQPDFGAALIFLIIWLGMMMAAGIKWKHFLILIFIAIFLFSLSWSYVLKDYQKQRIMTFIYPQKDIVQAGYQARQALIAIGQGGLWGKGLGRGSQAQLGFLPEVTTDFLFASFVEERGFSGAVLLMSLFLFVLWRIIKIARLAQNNFARLFCFGFSFLLLSQITINVGMNLALLPVIGLSLPFFSFGGSHLVTSFLGLGLIQSIKVNG